MPSFHSLSAIALVALTFLLVSPADARCHNLSSTAFARCPQSSGGAREVVKASATAPLPIKAMSTGGATSPKNGQHGAAVKAQENLPTDTSADATPWIYGNGANQTLPAPSATLMTVALGIGTQNYTCPSTPSTTPTLIGATAQLYHLSQPSSPVASISTAGLPAIGKHYFSSAGTPSFQFFDNDVLGLLQAAKKMQIPAPAPAGGAGAAGGTGGGGSVPWLQLVSTGTGNGKLQEVYRVQTVGGTPPAGECSGKAAGTAFEVPYRAQYWFYGAGS